MIVKTHKKCGFPWLVTSTRPGGGGGGGGGGAMICVCIL